MASCRPATALQGPPAWAYAGDTMAGRRHPPPARDARPAIVQLLRGQAEAVEQAVQLPHSGPGTPLQLEPEFSGYGIVA